MPSPAPPETRYRCRHVTRYDYGEDVPVSHHLLHLVARPLDRQRRVASRISIEPTPAVWTEQTDYFGNPLTYIAVQEPHRSLVITAENEVDVRATSLPDPAATPPWERLRDCLEALTCAEGAADVVQYAFDSAFVKTWAALADYARPSFPEGRPAALAGIDLTQRINQDFTFDATATTVSTPIANVMANRRGVCQDFAHLMIGCLRSLGLPARYVSGYLRTLPPPGQPRLVGADFSHAWVSLWCGGETWLDLCPTNGRVADQDFITLAWGRDYDDVSPARGVILGSGVHTLSVSVDVEPLEFA